LPAGPSRNKERDRRGLESRRKAFNEEPTDPGGAHPGGWPPDRSESRGWTSKDEEINGEETLVSWRVDGLEGARIEAAVLGPGYDPVVGEG